LSKRLKVESKQRTTISKSIVALIVFVASEIINNNINLKTKIISAKLKTSYCFVLCYDRALRRDSSLNSRKKLLKLILR